MEDSKKTKEQRRQDRIKAGPTPVGEVSESVRISTMSARGFYFVCYIGFYTSAIMYPNDLKNYITNENYGWFTSYFMLHGLAIYLFLTTARNPGWVMGDKEFQLDNSDKLSTGDLEDTLGVENGEEEKDDG